MSGFRLLKAWKKGKLYFGRYAVFVEDGVEGVSVEALLQSILQQTRVPL